MNKKFGPPATIYFSFMAITFTERHRFTNVHRDTHTNTDKGRLNVKNGIFEFSKILKWVKPAKSEFSKYELKKNK